MSFLSRKETLGCTVGSAALLGLSLATGVALPVALPAMIAQISLAAFISGSAVFGSYSFATRVVWPGLHAGWDFINNSKWFKKKDNDSSAKVVELSASSTPAAEVANPEAAKPEVAKGPSLLQRGIQLAKDLGQTISVKAQNAYAGAKEKLNQAFGFVSAKWNQAVDSVKVKSNQGADFAKAQWTKLKDSSTQTWQKIKNLDFTQWKLPAKFNFSIKPLFASKKKPVVVVEVAAPVVNAVATPAEALAPTQLPETGASLESAPQAASETRDRPLVESQPTLDAAPLATSAANDAPKAQALEETQASTLLTASVPLAAPAAAQETSVPLAAAQETSVPLAAAQEAPAPLAAAQEAPAAALRSEPAQEAPASIPMTPPRAAERAVEPPSLHAKHKSSRKPKSSRVSELQEDGNASDSASDREGNRRSSRARSPMPPSSPSRHASSHPPMSPSADVLSVLDQPAPTFVPLARASSDTGAAAPAQQQEKAAARRSHHPKR